MKSIKFFGKWISLLLPVIAATKTAYDYYYDPNMKATEFIWDMVFLAGAIIAAVYAWTSDKEVGTLKSELEKHDAKLFDQEIVSILLDLKRKLTSSFSPSEGYDVDEEIKKELGDKLEYALQKGYVYKTLDDKLMPA